MQIWQIYFRAFIAIIFWAFGPILLLSLKNVPVFLLESRIMIIGGLSLIMLNYKERSLQGFNPWGVLGIAGNQIAYLLSIRLIPVPITDFLFALWPIIVLFVIKKFLLNLKQIFAVILAISALLIIYEFVEIPSIIGVIFAILASLFWSLYMIKVSKSNKNSEFMLGVYLVIGGICALILSYFYSESYVLSNKDYLYILAIGGGPSGFAYLLWQQAINANNIIKISWLSFFIPLLTYSMLIALGMLPMNHNMLLPLILIFISSFIIFT